MWTKYILFCSRMYLIHFFLSFLRFYVFFHCHGAWHVYELSSTPPLSTFLLFYSVYWVIVRTFLHTRLWKRKCWLLGHPIKTKKKKKCAAFSLSTSSIAKKIDSACVFVFFFSNILYLRTKISVWIENKKINRNKSNLTKNFVYCRKQKQ